MSSTDQLAGCGDHSCDVARPKGQGTNAGCRCNERTLRRALRIERARAEMRAPALFAAECQRDAARAKVEEQAAKIEELRARLKEYLDTIFQCYVASGVQRLDGNEVASVRDLRAERDHLAALIEQAPHASDCPHLVRLMLTENDYSRPCTCWKSHARKET